MENLKPTEGNWIGKPQEWLQAGQAFSGEAFAGQGLHCLAKRLHRAAPYSPTIEFLARVPDLLLGPKSTHVSFVMSGDLG